MRKTARRGRPSILPALAVTAVTAGCAKDLDTTRTVPVRGTLGEEVYSVLCNRVGAQALPEDLTGASYRAVCTKAPDGSWAAKVDPATLPPAAAGAVDVKGNAVSVADQQATRQHAIGRIEALARRRADLVAALDAVFPDIPVHVLDLGNADPTKSCNAPAGTAATRPLPDELSDMLGRFTALYDDGTLPDATESLGRLMASFQASTDGQASLARFDARQGYRPIDVALGMARPLAAYPGLQDLTNATIRLLSADSDPYAENPQRDGSGKRIPVPGPAHDKLVTFLTVAKEEMRTAATNAPTPPLTTSVNGALGQVMLSRPRQSLEVTQELLLAQDSAYGSGAPSRFIVRRDGRGVAAVPLISGAVPAPFVDANGDGLPDLDPVGRFVTVGGADAPTPFLTVGGAATPRDDFTRALSAPGGPLVYGYVDTSQTYSAALISDLRPLLNPDATAKHETLMYALAGLPVLAGPRTTTSRCYTADPAHGSDCATAADATTVSYNGFDTSKSALLDLVHAFAQVLGDGTSTATLTLVKQLFSSSPNDVARVAGAGLGARALADQDTAAALTPHSVFWDDLLDVTVQIAQEPGLLEDMLVALSQAESLQLGQVFSNYMSFKDRITYDPSDLNGPPLNLETNSKANMQTPVDRTQPDNGFNRSGLQRFLALLNDTNGVAACNRDGAVVHAKLAGFLPVNMPLIGTYKECQVFKIDNLAAFYLQSTVGAPQASLYLRDDTLRNGIFGIGAATVGLMEDSSGITGFWDDRSSKTLRPTPQFLNRLVWFDVPGDTKNPTTRSFIADLQGPSIDGSAPNTVGTTVCPERVIADPSPTAADAGSDGKIHGLRACNNGEWLYQRHPDTLFVLEQFGGYAALTPLVKAFISRPHPRVDLFISLLQTLDKHWASPSATASECNLGAPAGGTAATCAKSNVVSYEPLLAKMFSGDVLVSVQSLLKTLQNVSVKSCTAADATGACTASTTLTGIQVLAQGTRALVDPLRAKAAGLTDRSGDARGKRNDGTFNPQVTPLYLILQALAGVDAAFAAYAPPDASDGGRQALWKTARSQIVDQFLAVNGSGATATFKNGSLPKILPTALDVLRMQLEARCPGSFAPPYPACTWARKDLVANVEASVGGPIFASAVDLIDALRKDDAGRTQLETLGQYLLDAASKNDALTTVLSSVNDLVQLMSDDANLVPLYKVLSGSIGPVKGPPSDGVGSGKSLVDANLALLARITGRAVRADGTRICARELDPSGVLQASLQRLVTPLPPGTAAGQKTPLEIILDVVSDVNRADPTSTAKLVASDYASISSEVNDFLMNKERGLEQFYEIVRRGTKTP